MSRVSAISPATFITFGDLLKHLRRQAGLTQRELSIAVGYSDTQISRMEQNQRVPDAATLTARFVPALHLEREPQWVARLLELAVDAHRDDGPASTADVSVPPVPRHNLPLQLTSFIGREKEIAEVQRLLMTNRLTTLTGAGGSGKTRLSLEVARALLDIFPDGVWFIELAPLANPELVPQTVATSLGLREEASRSITATLTGYLQAKTALLLLDNCEHLVQACAQLAETLLRACPNLYLLATSREALGVPGEVAFPIPTLSTPNVLRDPLPSIEPLTKYDSVRLFIERAQTALPEFTLTTDNAPAIAQVCHRLGGIPLAIELAAARVKTLRVEQIAARLDDRFRLLTGGSRTALPRHQTLRASIDWSYALLSGSEQILLRRLSVFAGGWRLEAAEAVCSGDGIESADVLDVLTQLVNKSIAIVKREAGRETRYRLLETIRQYAREKLLEAGEAAVVQARHLDFYLKLAEKAEPKLHGAEQMAWLERLEAEHDNVRAALEWSRVDEASEAKGLHLAGILFWFWHIHNYMSEGRSWLEGALTRSIPSERTLARAQALYATGGLGYKQAADYPRAQAQLKESITIFREAGAPGRRGLAYALLMWGELNLYHGDIVQSPALFLESVALFRELEDKWGLALSLHWSGVIKDPTHPDAVSLRWSDAAAKAQNDSAAARSLYEESLALFRELGDKWAQTMPLGSLGNMALCQGDHVAGRALFEESLAIQREFGDKLGVGWSLWALGNEVLNQNDYERATTLYNESLAIYQGMEQKQGIAALLGDLAEVARRQGDYKQATTLYEESLTIKRELGNRERIAFSLDGLGRVAWSQGDHASAYSLQTEALTLRREADNPISLAHSLEAFAILAAAQQQAERAVRLFGAAESFHEALYYSLLPMWRIEHDRGVAAAREQLGEAAFAQAWAEGRAMTMEQAIECALESATDG